MGDWRTLEIGGLDTASLPLALDRLERRFWLDLWHAPVLDAIEEGRIEQRWYGPVQAMVAADLPETPLLNLVLGAGAPGAVQGGHLAAALEWVESRGVDCRVAIAPERSEAPAAEELLNRHDYRRAESRVRFVRDAAPPEFPEPAGIEVDEIGDPVEGFSHFLVEGFELDLTACSFFDCLPGRHPWRCYFAVDEHEHCVASAAMMVHHDVAQLGFAATEQPSRGKGCHMALLHRRIADAAAAGCTMLFAETTELLRDPDGPSAGCRNLLRAGFRQASARGVWRALRG